MKCPQCGYDMKEEKLVRCPRCFKNLLTMGACSECGKCSTGSGLLNLLKKKECK